MADVQILYRYFLESGGYPKDIRGFATGLAEKFDVRIVCFPSKSGGREEFEAACDVEELDALSILRQLLFKETPKIHYVFEFSSVLSALYIFIAFFKKKENYPYSPRAACATVFRGHHSPQYTGTRKFTRADSFT